MSKKIIKYHPGEYIKDIIEELQMTQNEFAMRLGITSKQVSLIVNQAANITTEIAYKLANLLGTSPSMWLNLQNAYDTALEEEKNLAYKAEERKIYNYLDKDFLAELKLYDKDKSIDDNISTLHVALPVASLRNLVNKDIYAQCKTSIAKEMSEQNIVCRNVWISLACQESLKVRNVAKYDENKLKQSIPYFRKLTLLKPAEFYPELVKTLSNCGVIFIVLPSMKNSNTNGFVKWINNNGNVLLALSDRKKTNDIFWFTFFHELHHIFQKSKRNPIETIVDENEFELAADKSASEDLIAKEDLAKLTSYTSAAIKWLSNQIGIHQGIIVGRLQHEGKIPHSRHNNLKDRIEVVRVE